MQLIRLTALATLILLTAAAMGVNRKPADGAASASLSSASASTESKQGSGFMPAPNQGHALDPWRCIHDGHGRSRFDVQRATGASRQGRGFLDG